MGLSDWFGSFAPPPRRQSTPQGMLNASRDSGSGINIGGVNPMMMAMASGLLAGGGLSREPQNPFAMAAQNMMNTLPFIEEREREARRQQAFQAAAQQMGGMPGVSDQISGLASSLMGNPDTAEMGFGLMMDAMSAARRAPDTMQVPQGNSVGIYAWNPEAQSYEQIMSGYRALSGGGGGGGGGWAGGVRPRLPTGYYFRETEDGGMVADRIPGLPEYEARPMTPEEREMYGVPPGAPAWFSRDGEPQIRSGGSSQDPLDALIGQAQREMMESGELLPGPGMEAAPETPADTRPWSERMFTPEERAIGEWIGDLFSQSSYNEAGEPERATTTQIANRGGVPEEQIRQTTLMAMYRDPQNADAYVDAARERYGIDLSDLLMMA